MSSDLGDVVAVLEDIDNSLRENNRIQENRNKILQLVKQELEQIHGQMRFIK